MARSTASRRSSLTTPPPPPGSLTGSALLNAWLALRVPECQCPPSLRRRRRPARRVAYRRLYAGAYPPSVDRYGADVLDGDWRRRGRPAPANVPAEPGLVVENVDTGWCGAVVRVEKAGGMHVVHLEDRRGRTKGFSLGPGFLLDGAPVTLTAPTAAARAAGEAARAAASRTASGSRAVAGARARVASGSRIFVEGRHDAELVEKVWGDDLRIEGVVVELLEGVDDLAARDPGRRRPRVEADPGHGAHLRRPRADPAGQRRGADRLRDCPRGRALT